MFNPTLYQILISSTESDGVKTAVTALCALLCIALPYLLGSVNFALVISKCFYRDDIRKHGSGNAGMTNMLRTYGKVAAGATLLCDMLKATASVFFGAFVYGINGRLYCRFVLHHGPYFSDILQIQRRQRRRNHRSDDPDP